MCEKVKPMHKAQHYIAMQQWQIVQNGIGLFSQKSKSKGLISNNHMGALSRWGIYENTVCGVLLWAWIYNVYCI